MHRLESLLGWSQAVCRQLQQRLQAQGWLEPPDSGGAPPPGGNERSHPRQPVSSRGRAPNIPSGPPGMPRAKGSGRSSHDPEVTRPPDPFPRAWRDSSGRRCPESKRGYHPQSQGQGRGENYRFSNHRPESQCHHQGSYQKRNPPQRRRCGIPKKGQDKDNPDPGTFKFDPEDLRALREYMTTLLNPG